MDKRRKYSMTTKKATSPPSRETKKCFSPSFTSRTPRCSYMYGGLGDIRRKPYPIKSPLREETVSICSGGGGGGSDEKPVENIEPNAINTPKIYCNSAAIAAKLFHTEISPPNSTLVKINPLHNGVAAVFDPTDGIGGEARVFRDQLSKIRRTKDREMKAAIIEVARHAKKETLMSRVGFGGRRRKKRSGPFILRPRPPL